MTALDSLEAKLNDVLVKNAPMQLPENWRKWLAEYAWIFALIGCVLGGLALLVLLPALGFASVVSTALGLGQLVIFAWLSLLVLVAYVVILGISVPKLKRMEKRGWDLTFYSALFFLVYDVLNWMRYPSITSIFGLIWNVFWAVVGLYFIFQIRSYFLGKKAVEAKVGKKA